MGLKEEDVQRIMAGEKVGLNITPKEDEINLLKRITELSNNKFATYAAIGSSIALFLWMGIARVKASIPGELERLGWYEPFSEKEPVQKALQYDPNGLLEKILNNPNYMGKVKELGNIGPGCLEDEEPLKEKIRLFVQAIGGWETRGYKDPYNAENDRTKCFGKYQIKPKNWSRWAKEAGLGRNAPKTPRNQMIVATYKLGEFLLKYGNPEDAAAVWYSGHGAVARKRTTGSYNIPELTEKQFKRGEGSKYQRAVYEGKEPRVDGYVAKVMRIIKEL